MAQDKTIPKKSSVPGRVPEPEILDIGELAINTGDRKLYSKDANNDVFEIGQRLDSTSNLTVNNATFTNVVSSNATLTRITSNTVTSNTVNVNNIVANTVSTGTGHQIASYSTTFVKSLPTGTAETFNVYLGRMYVGEANVQLALGGFAMEQSATLHLGCEFSSANAIGGRHDGVKIYGLSRASNLIELISLHAIKVSDYEADLFVIVTTATSFPVGFISTIRWNVSSVSTGANNWRLVSGVTPPALNSTNQVVVRREYTETSTIVNTVLVANTIQVASGNSTVPSYAFAGDTSTGMYRVGAGTIAFTSAGTGNIRMVGANAVIGSTTTNQGRFAVYDNDAADIIAFRTERNYTTANNASTSWGIYNQTAVTFSDTVPNNHRVRAQQNYMRPAIPTGNSSTGAVVALWNSNIRNTTAADDNGTAAGIYGIYSEYGHSNADAAGTPQTTSVFGYFGAPLARTGLITNLYDIYLGGVTGTNYTSRWSLYSADAAAVAYHAGNFRIGGTSNTNSQLAVTDNDANRIAAIRSMRTITASNTINATYNLFVDTYVSTNDTVIVAKNVYGSWFRTRWATPTGNTNSATQYGQYNELLRNTDTADDAGTHTGHMAAIAVAFGHNNSNVTNTPVTSNYTGIRLLPRALSGTVQNLASIQIDAENGTNFGNTYSVLSLSNTAQMWHYGNVVIGTAVGGGNLLIGTSTKYRVAHNATDAFHDFSGTMFFRTTAGTTLATLTSGGALNATNQLSVGGTASTSVKIGVVGNLTGAVSMSGVSVSSAVQSDVTSVYNAYATFPSTQAATFTLADFRHYSAAQGTFGAGSTVTTQVGFNVDGTMIGATNNYGFRGQIAAGAGRFNLFMSGTADNHLAGNLLVGATTNPFTNKLYVTGVSSNTPLVGIYATGTGNTAGIGLYNDVDNRGIWVRNNDLIITRRALANTAIDLRLTGGTLQVAGNLQVTGPSSLIGYATGSGGAVTQATSRTTGVTLNKGTGSITLFTAAGSTTATSFTVTNSLVAATDTIILSVRGATNKYLAFVTNVAAGSFEITFYTTGGTASDTPIINFTVLEGVTA